MVIRPLEERDTAELRRIHSLPAVARWWGEPADGFPLRDDPEATRDGEGWHDALLMELIAEA